MRKDIMILDYVRCLRTPKEDIGLQRPTAPYRCPVCAMLPRNLTPTSNSARLRFNGDPTPQCEDHEIPVEMVPV